MKKISLMQVNFQQGPHERNSFWLPYSIGCIWAYAYSFTEIQNQYQLEHVGWRRDPIDGLSKLLAEQDIVVFSCYVWNRNYNYALSQAIKQLNPDCLIVFGGPELPVKDPEIFHRLPFVDIIIKNEGELVFKSLLSDLHNADKIPGLLINHDGVAVDTGEAPRINDLSILVSPYLSGFFDPLIKNFPEVEWAVTLETNRGCPYQCTFCDWGSLTYSKIKLFPLEKVLAELEWTSENQCGVIHCADANFGIFPERDHSIIDRFRELQERHGLPYYWGASWAKNQKKEVIGILKKLTANPKFYNLGLTLSLQSFDDTTLLNIKRKNMHDMTVQEMYKLAADAGVAVHTEYILGLPGETLHSWKENFFKLFRLNIHSFVDASLCQLLENSEMNQVQKDIYGIETAKVYDYLSGTYNNDQWRETIEITRSTDSMPETDMIDAVIFTWFMTTFHMNHFSSIVSRFMYKYQKVAYEDFYDKLFARIKDDPWFDTKMKDIVKAVTHWFEHGEITHQDLTNGIKIQSWNLMSATAMEIHLENKYNTVFDLVDQVLRSYDLPPDLHDELMTLQTLYPVNLQDLRNYPKQAQFNYNVFEFTVHDEPLTLQPLVLCFDFRFDKVPLTREHIERVYYSRKLDFAKTLINKLPVDQKSCSIDLKH